MLVPINLLEKIQSSVSIKFHSINNKDKTRLLKVLVELWLFIYEKQIQDDNSKNLKFFTQIHSNIIGNFFIKINKKKIGYKILLDILEHSKTIEINNNYLKGKYSYSYKILTDFIGTDYQEIDLDFNKIYSNFKDKSYWLNKYPNHQLQIKNSYLLKIDITKYFQWMKENIGLKLKPVFENGFLKERILTEERIFEYLQSSLKINLGNLWFKVSDQGRFYNSTTNLSYTALPFSKLNNREIFELDIPNCQPTLLATLVKNKQYKKDCEEGIFYDKMANEISKSRNEFKLLSYKYIFFSDKQIKSGIIYDKLEKIYPGLVSEINKLRENINISHEMQKIESKIMVNTIGSMENITNLLRHDAVYVCKEDYELVKSLMINEFKKIGLNIKINK